MANILFESQTAGIFGRWNKSTPALDPYLYLGNVKLHLADHKPMTDGDEQAWRICHELQDDITNKEIRHGRHNATA